MIRFTRRRLCAGALGLSALGVGCRERPPPVCVDESGLSPDEREVRRALGYVDRATTPARACAGCSQYVAAPAAGACGGCKLMKGPASPAGECRAFAPRG